MRTNESVKTDQLVGLCLGAVVLQLVCEQNAACPISRELAVGVAGSRMRSSVRLPVGQPMHVSRRCSHIRLLSEQQAEKLKLSSPAYRITLAADEGYDPEDDSEFYLHFPRVVRSVRRYATQSDEARVWEPAIIAVEDHHEWLEAMSFDVPKARNPRQFEYRRYASAVESGRIKSASLEEDENVQVQTWLRSWYAN